MSKEIRKHIDNFRNLLNNKTTIIGVIITITAGVKTKNMNKPRKENLLFCNILILIFFFVVRLFSIVSPLIVSTISFSQPHPIIFKKY